MSQAILLDLNKKFELNLEKAGITQDKIPTLEVICYVDKSGSMDHLYRSGFVNTAVNLFLPLALKFDDNGQIEMGFFDTNADVAPFATAADVGNYMARAKVRAGGGTNFAPIIRAIETQRADATVQTVKKPAGGLLGRLFGKTEEVQVAVPAQTQYRKYAAIQTDGDCFDESDFHREMAKTSGNTFYQFIALGTEVDAGKLQRLADQYPHVAFFVIEDPANISSDEFYQKIVNEKFTAWM